MGSSPHTRGAPHMAATASTETWDHPRIRGEHHRQDTGGIPGRGIIPAYAGSTSIGTYELSRDKGSSPHTRGAQSLNLARSRSGQDHPRIRGEHFERLVRYRKAEGIIPAYAGSTPSQPVHLIEQLGSSPHTRGALGLKTLRDIAERDHPRIRGEHS